MTFLRLAMTSYDGLEAVVDVDAELALGQVADVAHRGDDLVVACPRYLLMVFAFAGDSTTTSAFAITDLRSRPATQPVAAVAADEPSAATARSTCPSSSSSISRGSSFGRRPCRSSSTSSSRPIRPRRRPSRASNGSAFNELGATRAGAARLRQASPAPPGYRPQSRRPLRRPSEGVGAAVAAAQDAAGHRHDVPALLAARTGR